MMMDDGSLSLGGSLDGSVGPVSLSECLQVVVGESGLEGLGAACQGCQGPVSPSDGLRVGDSFWHQHCVKCAACGHHLQERCYEKAGQLYCKTHYYRLFSAYKCSGCGVGVSPVDLVYKLRGGVLYHLECHRCSHCGKDLAPGEQIVVDDVTQAVAFQNFPVCSLFSNQELQVGSVILEGLTDTSHIKGLIKANLAMSSASKDSFAKALFKWYPDTPNNYQSSNPQLNTGFANRMALTAASSYVTVLGSLPFDISGSQLSFPTGVELKISLQHRPNSERLQSDVANNAFRLQFEKCQLMVTYLTLNPGTLLSLRHRLSQRPIYYDYLKSSIVGPSSIAAGLTDTTLTISRGPVPELILVGLQPVTLSGADYAVNCFDFQPNQVSFMQANVNGVFFPSAPYTPDFANLRNVHQIYASFVEVCRALCPDGENVPDFMVWGGGLTLFPIQLRNHLPSPLYANEPMVGDLFLRIKFANPVPNALNCYVYTVSSARVGLDVNRTLTLHSNLSP